MSDCERGYWTKSVGEKIFFAIEDICEEEMRYVVFEYIREVVGTPDDDDSYLELQKEAGNIFDSCPDDFKVKALDLTEYNALGEGHQPHETTKESTVLDKNGDDAWLELCT